MIIEINVMKYYLPFVLIIVSLTNSYGQSKDIQVSDCRFNPSISFGKERMKLNNKEGILIKQWSHSVKNYADSTKQDYQITLWVWGNENSNKGILRAKIIADFMVKFEAIERRKINIIEISNKDDMGEERVTFGFDVLK